MAVDVKNVIERAFATGYQYVIGLGSGASLPVLFPGAPAWVAVVAGLATAVAASVVKNLGGNLTAVNDTVQTAAAVVDNEITHLA